MEQSRDQTEPYFVANHTLFITISSVIQIQTVSIDSSYLSLHIKRIKYSRDGQFIKPTLVIIKHLH